MSQAPTIGFIGVGLMGHGMAKNVLSKGHPLVALDHRKREPGDGQKYVPMLADFIANLTDLPPTASQRA